MPRLFHYFLPQALLSGRQILCFDGANRFDPLLIARFARQRGVPTALFNQRLRVARAFTCFQLTELLARLPRLLRNFPVDALMVTALPDLYFDEDVREAPAGASFQQALGHLRRSARTLPVAVFSDATSFPTPRQRFFRALAGEAHRVWKFTVRQDHSLRFACEKNRLPLPAAKEISDGTHRSHISPAD
jgi:hypothetical protein